MSRSRAEKKDNPSSIVGFVGCSCGDAAHLAALNLDDGPPPYDTLPRRFAPRVVLEKFLATTGISKHLVASGGSASVGVRDRRTYLPERGKEAVGSRC